MQLNLSLVLNALLLLGVVIYMIYLLRKKFKTKEKVSFKTPSLGATDNFDLDEVISVRKIETNNPKPEQVKTETSKETTAKQRITPASSNLMMFLLAKESRLLAGYELLQTLLACGLRFGEGQLFHRHQFQNGQGPVLCSLAAATEDGTFDLQNIGAFRVRGLCLFMQASGNPTIDGERFAIMLETARQLSDGLDTYLLDDKREPLTENSLKRYYRTLNLNDAGAYCEAV